MSKKAEIDKLARELSACGNICGDAAANSVKRNVVMRIVDNIAGEEWHKFRKSFPMRNWLTFSVPESISGSQSEALKSWLEENPWTLGKAAFSAKLESELLRSARSGGAVCIMLVSAGISNNPDESPSDKNTWRMDEALLKSITYLLESCDTICKLNERVFGVILPGMGQLKSRKFAENVQKKFNECASSAFESPLPACSIGIVNVVPGECASSNELLERAEKSLSAAILNESGNIYQESPIGDACGATLVHSHEKHFLFFGGDPK